MVDHQFAVSDDMLKSIGIVKGQMTLIDEDRLAAVLLQLPPEEKKEGGGSAINSLIAYSRLGGKGGLSCTLAEDDTGKYFLEEIAELGVEINQSKVAQNTLADSSSDKPANKSTTGRCLALISPDSERTMMTHLGINQQLTSPINLEHILQNYNIFYAESYLLSVPSAYQALLEHLSYAKAAGLMTSISMSDVSMVEFCRPQLEELLNKEIDILFGNHAELSRFTKEEEPHKIFAKFADNIKSIVLTLGADGAIIHSIGKDPIKISAAQGKVIDTLGAGDNFAGAFLYAINEKNLDYESAAKFAAQAASQVISRFGPRLEQAECDNLLNLIA